MNKKSKKTKGFPIRLLAMMLCCFCLLAAMPISAVALEAGESQITEESTLESQAENAGESLQPASSDIAESVNDMDDTSGDIVDPVTETETEDATDTEVETKNGIETEAETETDTNTNTETVTDTESEIATDTEAGTEAATENVTGTETETETGAVTGAEADTDAETEDGTGDETETETDAESEDEGDSTETQELSFYDQVMSAENCQSIYELVNANTDQASALSIEQVTAVKERAQGMEDDGYKEMLLQLLDQLLIYLGADIDAEYSVDTVSDIDESYYKDTIPVYWDTTTGMTTSASSAGGSGVSAVTLGGVTVAYGDADNTSWSGGTTLASYFSGASANNMTDATLSITADSGYYVTSVIVACAPSPNSGLSPFKCSTWGEGNEFIQSFNLTNSNYANGKYTLSFSINSRYFSHDGRTSPNAYFILIQVAQVPTPLYVEYNYGNVADFLTVDSSSNFSAPSWTVASDSNNYGTGNILTEDTQFAYGYDQDISVIENWSHTANSISSEALAEAAGAGYYFAGWSVTWYNECTVTNTSNTYGDSYTMSFNDVYMTGSYNPGDSVLLPTNVRLVAQWKPIELKVTKTVTGLADSDFASESHTYTIQVQKQNDSSGEWENYGDALTFAITGDGSLTQTLTAITPSTYRAVETGGNGNLSNSTTIMYITVSDSGQVTYDTNDIKTSQEIVVTNSYSSAPAAYDLTVRKLVGGNMYDENKYFTFTITADKEMTYGDTTGTTITVDLKKDGEATITVPAGAAVTVIEDPDGYTYSYVASESTINDYSDSETNSGITFTMPAADSTVVFENQKNVPVDTGVLLDTLPYILILGVVAVGAVLLIKKRRNRDDD